MPASDASARDDAPVEPTIDADPFGAWSMRVRVTELSSPGLDEDPTMTADLKEVVFSSNRVGSAGPDLWVATRASPSVAFDPPTLVAKVNTPGVEQHPSLSTDGLTLYFTSDRAGTQDIYACTRPDRTSDWSSPVAVTELNSAGIDHVGGMTPDQLAFVMSTDRESPGGDRDLWIATRPTKMATWSAPTKIPEASSASIDAGPSFAGGGDALYFARDNDLYVARRVPAGFAPAAKIPSLSSPLPEGDPFVTDDERLALFSYNDQTPAGYDIFLSTR